MFNKKLLHCLLLLPILFVMSGCSDISDTVQVQDDGFQIEKIQLSVVIIVATKDISTFREASFDTSDPFFNFPYYAPDYDKDEGEPQKIGGGSGFIVAKDGLILTTKHVVGDKSADYTVVTHDGTEYEVEIIFRDPLNDVAVIKIEDKNWPALIFGESDVQIGQKVAAFGGGNTVSEGAIAATERDITAGTIKEPVTLKNLLQTDTVISPGSSGGPLLNMNSEVIGINVAIARYAQDISFAIPIDDAKSILDDVR